MSLNHATTAAIKDAKQRQDWVACVDLCSKAIDDNSILSPDDIYGLKLTLAMALLEDHSKWEANCEKALSIYEYLLSGVSAMSSRWTSLNRNLGYVYRNRAVGEKDKNIVASIRHYEDALQGLENSEDATLRASIHAEIGHAYLELECGSRLRNAQRAGPHAKRVRRNVRQINVC